jgi:D-alanyl-D-alanine carboxypeptidase (penicillin-binding protein 5/6)
MTYYVAEDALPPGREVVAAPYDPEPGESLAGLEAGDTLSVRDALYGLLVPSGNDAALTLALAVSGSESDFVARMNAAAADLGLAETEYADPIGLDSGDVSSARDLVSLSTELQKQKLFRRIVDTPRATLRSTAEPLHIVNRNALVLEKPFIDGIKTGTTLEAGYVLVASGTQEGVGLTSVVLGSPDEGSRDSATLALLDYGFSLYEKRALVQRGERIGFAPLADGGRLPLESASSLRDVSRANQKVEVTLAETAPVEPPVVQGEPVGAAVVRLDGKKVGTVETVAARDVAGIPEPEAESTGLPSWAWIVFGVATLIAAVLGALAIGVHRRE